MVQKDAKHICLIRLQRLVTFLLLGAVYIIIIIIIIIIINEKKLAWRLVPRNCKDTEHTLIDDVFSTVQY